MSAAQKLGPTLLKRYARSRLYDTMNRRYFPVEQLQGWAVDHVPFAAIDRQAGTVITRVLLPAGLKIC